MISVELAPEVSRGRISKVVKDITGVLPVFSIAQGSRVAFTIDKELTDAEKEQLSLALNDIQHFNWKISLK